MKDSENTVLVFWKGAGEAETEWLAGSVSARDNVWAGSLAWAGTTLEYAYSSAADAIIESIPRG